MITLPLPRIALCGERVPAHGNLPCAVVVESGATAPVGLVDRSGLRSWTAPPEGTGFFAIHVDYYQSPTRGRTIHSPRNCLPGSGWEPLTLQREMLSGPYGDLPVSRYLLQNGEQLALVLYWYLRRGRAAANEYGVKWDLLRDAAFRGRSEEALVRVVVPVVGGGEEAAWQLGRTMAAQLADHVDEALPAWD